MENSDILSNLSFAVNKDRDRLPCARVDGDQVAGEAPLDLAELVAPAELDRLVPRGRADEILERQTRHVVDVLEPHAHPERGAGEVAALDEARFAAAPARVPIKWRPRWVNRGKPQEFDAPAVIGNLWRNSADTETRLFLANISDAEQTVSLANEGFVGRTVKLQPQSLQAIRPD